GAIAQAGSDWEEWRVRDVATAQDLPDVVKWVKFSGAAWTRDGKGFFYSRYDEPKAGTSMTGANYYHKLYYHKLGTPQSDDPLIYDRPDQKEWNINGAVTDDGRYLMIYATQGTDRRNRIFYKDLQSPDSRVKPLFDKGDASYAVIGNDGTTVFVRTDLDAPRGRVITADIHRPEPAAWKEVIPQTPEPLEGSSMFGNLIVASYLKDAQSVVKVFDLSGKFL